MQYKYRRPKANNNNNSKTTHWVNTSFNDGDGEEQLLKNKFISLKESADADVWLMEQYEEKRTTWEAKLITQNALSAAELKKIPEANRVPAKFHYKIPAYIEVVAAQTDHELPSGGVESIISNG